MWTGDPGLHTVWRRRFDLNYVGCEPGIRVYTLSGVEGLIWTMWDVNTMCPETIMSAWDVWSELCGMWTRASSRSAPLFARVWSELCGMWTRMCRSCSQSSSPFDLNYVGCELILVGKSSLSSDEFDLNYVGCEHYRAKKVNLGQEGLIWTMWDVNWRFSCFVSPTKPVWSEPCGMWTTILNEYVGSVIQFDLNYVGCERAWRVEGVNRGYGFDLNYVGCEHKGGFRRGGRLLVFDLNYVGCENKKRDLIPLKGTQFDLNYVGCEHGLCDPQNRGSERVWSELCGMWTWRRRIRYPWPKLVWSELCGMWTNSWSVRLRNFLSPFDLNYVGCERILNRAGCSITSLFDLNYVGCELSFSFTTSLSPTCLIWTMWDVNELSCLEYNSNCQRLIWTMWDVNTATESRFLR